MPVLALNASLDQIILYFPVFVTAVLLLNKIANLFFSSQVRFYSQGAIGSFILVGYNSKSWKTGFSTGENDSE